MTGLLRCLRSDGTLWRQSPQPRYPPTGRPDCSACTAGSRSPSLLAAMREDRHSSDLRLSKGTMAGSRPRWSRPSTRIARRPNGRAPGPAPSEDRPQPPSSAEYMWLAISRSFRFRWSWASIAGLRFSPTDRAFSAGGPPVFRPLAARSDMVVGGWATQRRQRRRGKLPCRAGRLAGSVGRSRIPAWRSQGYSFTSVKTVKIAARNTRRPPSEDADELTHGGSSCSRALCCRSDCLPAFRRP